MKQAIIALLFIVVGFFFGHVFASSKMLLVEFTETNSNVISRSFIERYSMYKLLRQGDSEKLKMLLESLLFSDIVGMRVIQLSRTSNFTLLCGLAKDLEASLEHEVFFSEDLSAMLESCE